MPATSSDVGSKLIAWVMAGVGSLLAYSAYKNRAPWDVLRDIQGSPIDTTTTSSGSGPSGFFDSSATPSTFSSSIPRIRMIANREIPPVLVNIRPSGQLDKDAAASLERIHQRVGFVVRNTSGYRSFASQAASYNQNEMLSDGSPRFASPSKSLHVVGLAIDVHTGDLNKPGVIAAFTAEGWQRARPNAEPWHFSYLVRG